ncbi:hypothetical protein HII31_13605 [Pseudocercospora fuligena]|uniref:Uncharacterized protein n=1 Tax=Pseudocercospora fuligena TaxID=685502 RepID=A0A8H6R6Y7_9PEZI|nr:hypothetical protein HII31_13605 [Pseudocercospora fuligena]
MQSLYTPISSSSTRPQPWKPSRWSNVPWFGLLAWVGAILATIGTVVVLTTSNLKPTDEWPSKSTQVQPTVLLAVLTALANTFSRFALSEGATIAWWTAVLRGGTINHLHQVWSQGVSVRAAAFSGRHSTLLAVACILTSAVVIDGPLLQRASRVETYIYSQVVDLDTNLFSKDLPQFFSAYTGYSNNFYTQPFVKIVQDFNRRSAMNVPGNFNCSGNCTATFVAPIFDVDCRPQTASYDLTMPSARNGYTDVENIGFVGIEANDSYVVNVTSLYKNDPACKGQLTGSTCLLRNAVGTYSITFGNGRITDWEKTDTISISNYTDDLETQGVGIPLPSTNGGFIMLANALYSGNVSMQWTFSTPAMAMASPENVLDSSTTGPFATNYMNSLTLGTSSEYVDQLDCSTTWSDPLPDILDAMQELMLRSAISLSNSSTPQTVHAEADVIGTQYISDFRYLAAALAVMLVSSFIVLPLLTGWWRFGRSMSLSPIEIAKAFGAPELDEGSSMDEVAGLLKSVGGKKVMYGAVGVETKVVIPKDDDAASDAHRKVQRLAIAEAERVAAPRPGQFYC